MKRNVARMRYQTDKRSSSFCILAIVFNVIYFLSLYSNNSLNPDFQMGLDVLYNILFMLFAFLTSEKVKAYAKNWSYYAIIGGALQVLRIFWLPAHYLKAETLTHDKWIILVAALAASAVCLVLAGINCYMNSTTLEKYLAKENNHG